MKENFSAEPTIEPMIESVDSLKNPEVLIDKEKQALSAFSGENKKESKKQAGMRMVFLLASALAITGCSEKREHQEHQEHGSAHKSEVGRTELSDHQAHRDDHNLSAEKAQGNTESAESIEHRKDLSASSLWVDSVVEAAENDIPHLKTPEDAEWFMRSTFSGLIMEFYFPTKGEFFPDIPGSSSYGQDIKMRKYTYDDGEHFCEGVEKLIAIAKEVDKKFGTDFYEKGYSGQMPDILAKARIFSSYAHRKQVEALIGAEQIFSDSKH